MIEITGIYGLDWTLLTVAAILAIVIGVLLVVAYYTYAERKVLGAMQRRQGPMTVGPFGLLQPIADGLKLFSKETIIPSQANKPVFVMAPMMLFALSLMAWAVIPFDKGWVLANINVGILYLFAVSSMMVYGVLMAGWASNSRYAFLGGLRSASQMVSYEVSMGLIIVSVILCTGSLNLSEIVEAPRPIWMQLLLFPMFIVFLVSILAETNRAPFDLPEGESEITGGFMVEYSAMTFALFFLGEYSAMVLMSSMTSVLFLGGWLPPFSMWMPEDMVELLAVVPGIIWFALKTMLVMFFFLWARATLPRYRYDQLMRLGWKIFLPLTLVWVVVVSGTLMTFNALPNQKTPDNPVRDVITVIEKTVQETEKGVGKALETIAPKQKAPSNSNEILNQNGTSSENLENNATEESADPQSGSIYEQNTAPQDDINGENNNDE